MNADLEQLRAKDQYIRWGTQTVGIAIMVKVCDKDPLALHRDAARGMGRKAHSISLALWDNAANTAKQPGNFNSVIGTFTASIFTWAEDHIGEMSSFQRDFQTLVSLKTIVKEAIQKCSVSHDNTSEETLRSLGQILNGYLESHDSRYPDNLFKLDEWPRDPRFQVDFTWVSQHITYLGSRVSRKSDPSDMIIAYDHSMLTQQRDTYVLFNDGHVEYISQQRAAELGLY